MKTSSFLALSAAASVALVTLAGASFLTRIPGELVVAGAASLAIVGLMIADYRRYVRPLAVSTARLVRPPAPIATGPRVQRTAAHGIRRQSAIVERSAA